VVKMKSQLKDFPNFIVTLQTECLFWVCWVYEFVYECVLDGIQRQGVWKHEKKLVKWCTDKPQNHCKLNGKQQDNGQQLRNIFYLQS